MILVDTSVWVDHLRKTDKQLVSVLTEGQVLCHPFVIGELACGNIRNRAEILALLASLPCAASATHEEALSLVAKRGLSGRGLGWVDAHLLASSLISGAPLWTNDKALRNAAKSLKAAYAAGRSG